MKTTSELRFQRVIGQQSMYFVSVRADAAPTIGTISRAADGWFSSTTDGAYVSQSYETRGAAADMLVQHVRDAADKARAKACMASHSRAAYRFFRKHAGGVVGQNAQTALHLARAEAHADEQGWTVEWEHDNDGGDDGGLGDHAYWCPEAKRADREDREPTCEHEVLCAVLRNADGAHLASLGACIDVSRDYARVVEAELAIEAMADAAKPSVPPGLTFHGPLDGTGYISCACRDCMEIAIGPVGTMCGDCAEAGCDAFYTECRAPDAYGGGDVGSLETVPHAHPLTGNGASASIEDETSSIVVGK